MKKGFGLLSRFVIWALACAGIFLTMSGLQTFGTNWAGQVCESAICLRPEWFAPGCGVLFIALWVQGRSLP